MNITKESVLDKLINIPHGYIMTNKEDELNILEQLRTDGLVLRVDDINPKAFDGFNESYSYVTNDERGKSFIKPIYGNN